MSICRSCKSIDYTLVARALVDIKRKDTANAYVELLPNRITAKNVGRIAGSNNDFNGNSSFDTTENTLATGQVLWALLTYFSRIACWTIGTGPIEPDFELLISATGKHVDNTGLILGLVCTLARARSRITSGKTMSRSVRAANRNAPFSNQLRKDALRFAARTLPLLRTVIEPQKTPSNADHNSSETFSVILRVICGKSFPMASTRIAGIDYGNRFASALQLLTSKSAYPSTVSRTSTDVSQKLDLEYFATLACARSG